MKREADVRVNLGFDVGPGFFVLVRGVFFAEETLDAWRAEFGGFEMVGEDVVNVLQGADLVAVLDAERVLGRDGNEVGRDLWERKRGKRGTARRARACGR